MSAVDLNASESSLWALKRAFPIAVLSIAFATISSLVSPPRAQLPADVPAVPFVQAMVRWDAGWYGSIAEGGYWLKPGEQSPVAFFPLYPMAIRALTFVGVNRWVGGMLISLTCALIALVVFTKWVRLLSPAHATTAFALLALYPFAEYLYGVIYSDALFLVLAVSAFVSLEKGHLGRTVLFGALATACRPVGPAIVVGLLARSIELRRRKNEPFRVLDFVPALSGAGLLLFMIFLQWRFNDPLAFAHIQSAPGWEHTPGFDSWFKLEWFRVMTTTISPLVAIRLGGHALVTVVALALVIPTFKRLGWGYGTYCLLAVGIPALSSKDFQGLGRYVIAAFPLFLTVALLLEDRPLLKKLVLVAFALSLCALAIALGAGGFVA